MIFWGPPAPEKPPLPASSPARRSPTSPPFRRCSSVEECGRGRRGPGGTGADRQETILFVDEIHRFNKAQQDAFLPHVEAGASSLIGATTENPSFEVIAPLLSRARVYVLEPLGPDDLKLLLRRALDAPDGLGGLDAELPDEAADLIVLVAQGDARAALTALELVVAAQEPGADGRRRATVELTRDVIQRKFLLYDKSGEQHFNLISALHKSLRDSDPDGALYWLARMLEAGEDPLYVARRLVRFASEDIGNADPVALTVAMAAMQAFHFIGLPEGELSLAQAAVYLATAPKSEAPIYRAYGKVKSVIGQTGTLPVPLHIRNAPTRLHARSRLCQGVQYAHDYEEAIMPGQSPENLRGRYTSPRTGYKRLSASV